MGLGSRSITELINGSQNSGEKMIKNGKRKKNLVPATKELTNVS
jgi:hypothetical protein